MIDYIKTRLSEKSTWAGIIAFVVMVAQTAGLDINGCSGSAAQTFNDWLPMISVAVSVLSGGLIVMPTKGVR